MVRSMPAMFPLSFRPWGSWIMISKAKTSKFCLTNKLAWLCIGAALFKLLNIKMQKIWVVHSTRNSCSAYLTLRYISNRTAEVERLMRGVVQTARPDFPSFVLHSAKVLMQSSGIETIHYHRQWGPTSIIFWKHCLVTKWAAHAPIMSSSWTGDGRRMDYWIHIRSAMADCRVFRLLMEAVPSSGANITQR